MLITVDVPKKNLTKSRKAQRAAAMGADHSERMGRRTQQLDLCPCRDDYPRLLPVGIRPAGLIPLAKASVRP
jgi:hypothetical protein